MIAKILCYASSFFLGWGLGANDSANVFGTAVSSRMVNYRTAILCTAFFVMLGAVLQGGNCIETLAFSLNSGGGGNSFNDAMVMSVSAAATIFVMTILHLPASTSQSVVGAIIGVGLIKGDVNFAILGKIVACWIGTPIGGVIFSVIFYHILKRVVNYWGPTTLQYDRLMKALLILSGCYGAYALGANNVANVTAIFVSSGTLSTEQATWLGGAAIAFGILTYSKPVMMTVGNDIIKLDAFMAFITVLSMSATVYIYTLVGVPVSTTQAVVGAVLGFGLIKGVQTVNFKTIGKITLGWLATPVCGGLVAAAAYFAVHLKYVAGP